jgi:hypothetical protein
MVDESPSDDNSVAIMHPNTMEALGLFRWVCSYHILISYPVAVVMLTHCSGDTVIGTLPLSPHKQLLSA